MATAPEFGIQINRQNDEPRPAVPGNFSTVGMIVTAPDAEPGLYPYGTPVRVNSGDAELVSNLGATGTAKDQVDLINANSGGRGVDMVLIRINPGASEQEAMDAVIAALPTLQASPQDLGVTPRLIAVPGYTHQQADPQTANPVVAALGGVLDALKAHAVVTGPSTTLQAFTDWRETISHGRIIPQETQVKVGTDARIVDAAGAVLGQIVARDAENGGRPFKSAANRALSGIVAAARGIPFSITDGSTEGQQILAADGGIIVRGERGVAGAIADAGFVYIGYATASDDDLYRFYNVSRGRDYIELLMQATLAFYLGKYNLTPRTVEIVLQTMDSALSSLRATGDIIDYRVAYDPDKNSPEELRLGKLTVGFRCEEAPVLRQITVDSGRYRDALITAFANFDIAA